MHQVSVETRLTNDLLDASRIQNDKLRIVPTECDLVNIVREIVDMYCLSSPEREITFEAPPFSVSILADADRIGQVVSNYVANALKYSEETEPIAVGIDIDSDEQSVRVWVHDHGPGLSSEAQAHIWERFYQVQGMKGNSAVNGFGLGLGLHICHTLIERHGGKVGIESVVGQGSTFWFTLPLMQKIERIKEYSGVHTSQIVESRSPIAD
jgi:signal transduction histidine kinase